MSKTLKLTDRLLAMGRNLQSLGRDRDALHILGRLIETRQLPVEVSEEAQSRLAEMLLRAGRYAQARRRLTALLTLKPESARYHYLMAVALNADVKCDPHRAAQHYRKSLQLDSQQPPCLSEYGLLLLRLGKTEDGLAKLRQAVELAPHDPEMVSRLTEGLRQEGLMEEVETVLRTAFFRNARDGRFRKLWNHFRFQCLREEQQAGQVKNVPAAVGNGPTLLPFIRPENPLGRKSVRHDAASSLQPPHTSQTARLPGKKQAQ